MTDSDSMHFGSALAGIGLIVALVAVIYYLTAGSFPPGVEVASGDDDAMIAQRLEPIGKVRLAGEAPAPTAAPEGADAEAGGGEATYNKSCVACHAAGVAGAPKLGDKVAWEPRVATGIDAMLNTAINGKGAMPPRGTCASCSEDDLKAAIEFMLSKLE